MIAAYSYAAFREAASQGHLPILKWLVAKAPDKLQDMIATYSYEAFSGAVCQGHLPILEWLAEKAPDELQDMIAAYSYRAFREAASHGQLPILEWLAEKTPDKLQDMIAAGDYMVFCEAASQGQLHILKWLAEKAPDKLQDMIASNDCEAFSEAASKGHLPILEWLAEKAPDKLQDMIASNGYRVFQHAIIVHWFLDFSKVFTYAEAHTRQYQSHVHPYVTRLTTELRAEKNRFEADNPYGVFDIQDSQKAQLLFYVIRNLIRRNDVTLRDDIQLLIEIPAVKALLHTEVTIGQSNELLRLALSIRNQAAAALLLNIPAVRELAERNRHYGYGEARGTLDLRALAIVPT